MSDAFIKMIHDIDFLYGYIYECANLINNLYDYDNYDHLVIKLCSEFVLPIIYITKNEHIKVYNEHIKDTISTLERTKDIYSIYSYLMNICCEGYLKLSQDKYLERKKFIDNNMDITESAFAPMHDFLDLYKNCYGHYYCSCYYYHKKENRYIFPANEHKEFCEKIIKSYFDIEYIKFFYLLQKNIKLNKNKNIRNINVLIDIFMNLFDNSNIDCNKKIENKIYDLYNNIILNKFVTNNNDYLFSNYK